MPRLNIPEKTRALVLIGGITADEYIEHDVTASGFDTTKYNKVLSVEYDYILDVKYQWVPWYSHLKFLDRHGDWWQFALHPDIRQKVRQRISTLLGYFHNVDVMAHSLGAWAVLGCDDKVGDVYLFGCPLGEPLWLLRHVVETELDKSIKLKADNLFYVYNKHDGVSCRCPKKGLLESVTTNVRICSEIGTGHDLQLYLKGFSKYLNGLKV